MRRTRVATAATATLIAAALALPLSAAQAEAASAAAAPQVSDSAGTPSDDLTPPDWRLKYDQIRQDAIQQRLRTGGKGAAEKVGKRTFGRVAQTGTDRIFVVLADFGDTRHSAYPDDPESGAQRFDGPLNNEIPKPNRKVDNSTNWNKDYSQKYFNNMYFNRMKSFYEQQSSGKYSISGAVTEWVTVPFNQARYGNDACGDVVCNSVWFLVRDALAQWTQDKLDAGWSMAKIQTYLKTFDKQDRYDFDEDGDFNEPDSYIEYFQIVHAGGDEADGDPIYGADAIWSHRWNAQVEPYGTGPEGGAPIGGVNVGEGGRATAEPSRPPTTRPASGSTTTPSSRRTAACQRLRPRVRPRPRPARPLRHPSGGDNSVEHWDLIRPARGTLPRDASIGDQPQPFGAWDKFQLGGSTRPGWDRPPGTYKIRPGYIDLGSDANRADGAPAGQAGHRELGDPCATCGFEY